jgi:hypothetical protein
MELPECKRYITTVLSDGTSVHKPFSPLSCFDLPGTGTASRSYSVKSIPAQLQGEEDVKAYESNDGIASYKATNIVSPGANLTVVNFQPGGASPMHKTPSLDFSICVLGRIDHVLDSGEVIRLNPGVSHLSQLSNCFNSFHVDRTTLSSVKPITNGSMPRRQSRPG